MTVTILGDARGETFAANEIDTPYRRTYPVAYEYGPSFGFGFGPAYYGAGPFGYGYGYGSPFYGAFPGATFGYGPVILDNRADERNDSARSHGK